MICFSGFLTWAPWSRGDRMEATIIVEEKPLEGAGCLFTSLLYCALRAQRLSTLFLTPCLTFFLCWSSSRPPWLHSLPLSLFYAGNNPIFCPVVLFFFLHPSSSLLTHLTFLTLTKGGWVFESFAGTPSTAPNLSIYCLSLFVSCSTHPSLLPLRLCSALIRSLSVAFSLRQCLPFSPWLCK